MIETCENQAKLTPWLLAQIWLENRKKSIENKKMHNVFAKFTLKINTIGRTIK